MWQFCYLQFGGAHVFDWWWLTGLCHNKDVADQRDWADQVEDGHRHSKLSRPADSKICAHNFTFPVDIIFKNGDSQSNAVTEARKTVDICLHLEDVLLCTVSRPWRPISKTPQEAQISSCADPTIHHHRVVQQDGHLVLQPVESNWSLDDQRNHVGGDLCPSS